MKKNHKIMMLVLLSLVSCDRFSPKPKSVFPDFLKGKIQRTFNSFLKDSWDKIGPSKEWNVIVHSNSIKMYNRDNINDVQHLKRGDKATFIDWVFSNDEISYRLRWNKTIYVYKTDNIWNILSIKHDDEKFYNKIVEKIKALDDYEEHIRFIYQINNRYEQIFGKKIINDEFSLLKLFLLDQYAQLGSSDVSLALLNYKYRPKKGSLIFVQKPQGLQYTKRNPKFNQEHLKTPFFNKESELLTPFRFIDYIKINNKDPYILAKMYDPASNSNIDVWIEIDNYDDVLAVPPKKVHYLALIDELVKSNDCDDILTAYRYFRRHLHSNAMTDEIKSRATQVLKSIVLSSKNCKKSRVIGPHETVKLTKGNNKYIPRQFLRDNNLPTDRQYQIGADPIVRLFYNNNSFLIPAWINYNFKRSHKTGVIVDPFRLDRCKILKRRRDGVKYKVLIPPLNELLNDADLSRLLGYSFRKIIIDQPISRNTNSEISSAEFNELFAICKKNGCNALVVESKDSYNDIAKNAYFENSYRYNPDINMAAKALFEFNSLAQSEGIASRLYVHDSRLFQKTNKAGRALVPIELSKIGINYSPIKYKFGYKATLY